MLRCHILASAAGVFAASAGTFGKLSGEYTTNILWTIILIALMIICNVMMWNLFTQALSLSKTSIGPTMVSAASNYIVSGIVGITVFEERTSLLWWSGIGMVLIGLMFIVKANKEHNIIELKHDKSQ